MDGHTNISNQGQLPNKRFWNNFLHQCDCAHRGDKSQRCRTKTAVFLNRAFLTRTGITKPQVWTPISSSTTKPRNGPMASGSMPRPTPSPRRCGINCKAHRTSRSKTSSWDGELWCPCCWVTSNCTAFINRTRPRAPINGSWTVSQTSPAAAIKIPDLLKDPFLTRASDSDQTKPRPPSVLTAMPWLASDEEPRSAPAPAPTKTPDPDPVPNPEPTVTPEADLDVEIAKQKPEPTTEEPPLTAVEPTPKEPETTHLLEHSWLRVQLRPEIKNPTGSVKAMGLINRIRGAFGRSAGR